MIKTMGAFQIGGRESFTVVDHTNSNASMYGNENNNNADINYPGEKPSPDCYKLRRHVIPVFTALTIIAVTTILIVKYFPDEEELKEFSNATIKIEPNTAGALEFYPALNPKKTDTVQTTGVTTHNVFNVDLMKYLVEPLKYDIFIHLSTNSSDSSTFYGNASIELIAKEKTQYIVIGASDLGIIAVTLSSWERTSTEQEEQANLQITIDSYNRDKGILVIRVKDHLQPHNRYLLRIEYNGSVNRAPFGLFVTYHKLPGRETIKTLIASNTEWPFERTIFPCFGLPTQRAIFNVNICRPATFFTTSSSSLSHTVPDSSRNCVWDQFSPTKKLATHLLGFVITDYLYVQRIMENGITVTIWHPLDRATIVILYLLDMAPKLVNVFEDYFGTRMPTNSLNIYCIPSIVPYIRAKLGLVLIPDIDTTTTETEMSEQHKENLLRTLAAHIAEQWIEYYITFEPGDRWIAESLVQYLEYVAIDTIEPKWRIFDELLISVQHPLLNAFTANPNRKPIRMSGPPSESLYPVNVTSVFRNHDQYWTLLHYFDDNQKISPSVYSELFAPRRADKGVCFFRMLQHVLTEEIFRDALKKFIEFGNGKIVTGDDLWNIMTAEAANTTMPGYELLPPHMTLKVIVNEWIFDTDYPVLKVATGHEKRTISFEQILDKRDEANPQQSAFKHVPISYTTSEEKDFASTTPKFWLCQRNQTFQNAGFTNDTWLVLNVQQTGLYRVQYDENIWLLLQDCLEQRVMPATVRAQFLSDALFLGFSGYIDYEAALNLTRSLVDEKEYVVWYTVLSHFEYIENTMVSVNDRTTLSKFIVMLKRYIKHLITPVFAKICADQMNCDIVQDHNELSLRAYIHRWACKVDESQCVAKVRNDFGKWRKQANPDEQNPIHPNMRYATLCGMMYHADVTDFEFLFNRYLNTSYTNPNKQIYLQSLYCYKQIGRTIHNLLSTTLLNDYSLLHLTEINDVWKTLVENPILSTSPFDFLAKNWQSILKNFSEYAPIMINIIKGATVNISGEDQLNTVHQLRKDDKYNLEYLQDTFTEMSEKIKSRINWKYRGLGVFVTWLLKTSAYDLNKVTTNTTITG